jgi:oxygen-independent coproporphyrinogen-3 oxidase
MFPDKDLLSHKENADRYVEALNEEIFSFNGENKRCRGISFGGGTPSLLAVGQLERLLNALLNCCGSYDEKAQISLEVFPGTKSRDELKTLRSMGFNRASLGAQSFVDEELRFWGRAHNVRTFYKTYDDLVAAGFDNVNIDILFGLPTDKPLSWKKSVDSALDLQPKHLTTYYWHPSRGNAFCNDIKQGVLKAPDRETSIAQYQYAIDAAAKKGLNRYWNFNFSADEELQYAIERDTFRYFPIRGFGPGAWSQEKRWRIQNPPKLQPYLKGNSQDRQKHECTVEHYVLLT